MATPQLMAPLSPFLLGPMWLPELSWPLWGSACPQLLCAELQFPHGSHSPIHIRSSQIYSSFPSRVQPVLWAEFRNPRSCCFIGSCSRWLETHFQWGFPTRPRAPASLQTNHHEPKCITWTGRQRLCQCWGHSLTCLHSPHWGAVLQSTHRMLQMQRLQKAVKNKQHFNFISFQHPPHQQICATAAQQHQSPRVRLSITPRTQSIAIHYSCTLPKCQYREPEDLKPCCFT